MANDLVRYALIDGASLHKQLDFYSALIGRPVADEISWQGLLSGNFRIIYYDALPAKKSDQSAEDHTRVEAGKMAFFDGLRMLQDWHVRDGITRLRSSGRRDRLSEVLEQKGVDTWIAVDAVKLALQERADIIEIWTSDSDLFPVFEVLQETKCKGYLRYHHGRTSKELILTADRARPITLTDFAQAATTDELRAFQIGASNDTPNSQFLQDNRLERIDDRQWTDQDWSLFYCSTSSAWSMFGPFPGYTCCHSKHLLPVLEAAQHVGARPDIAKTLEQLRGKGYST